MWQMNSDSLVKVGMPITMGQHGIKSISRTESSGLAVMKRIREHHICSLIKSSITQMEKQKFVRCHTVHLLKNLIKPIRFVLQQVVSCITIYLVTKQDESNSYMICVQSRMLKFIRKQRRNMISSMKKKYAYLQEGAKEYSK